MKVIPRNDKIRESVRHPTGVGFRDGSEGTEWPDDSFTARRIRDGDISVVVEKTKTDK